MNVRVNDNCIGCGACSAIASSLFVIQDGKAHVLRSPKDTNEEEAVKNAADLCPAQAIEYD
ncbi:MAG: ferredoxin [Candidatus Woesearchaeota archaeon]